MTEISEKFDVHFTRALDRNLSISNYIATYVAIGNDDGWRIVDRLSKGEKVDQRRVLSAVNTLVEIYFKKTFNNVIDLTTFIHTQKAFPNDNLVYIRKVVAEGATYEGCHELQILSDILTNKKVDLKTINTQLYAIIHFYMNLTAPKNSFLVIPGTVFNSSLLMGPQSTPFSPDFTSGFIYPQETYDMFTSEMGFDLAETYYSQHIFPKNLTVTTPILKNDWLEQQTYNGLFGTVIPAIQSIQKSITEIQNSSVTISQQTENIVTTLNEETEMISKFLPTPTPAQEVFIVTDTPSGVMSTQNLDEDVEILIDDSDDEPKVYPTYTQKQEESSDDEPSDPSDPMSFENVVLGENENNEKDYLFSEESGTYQPTGTVKISTPNYLLKYETCAIADVNEPTLIVTGEGLVEANRDTCIINVSNDAGVIDNAKITGVDFVNMDVKINGDLSVSGEVKKEKSEGVSNTTIHGNCVVTGKIIENSENVCSTHIEGNLVVLGNLTTNTQPVNVVDDCLNSMQALTNDAIAHPHFKDMKSEFVKMMNEIKDAVISVAKVAAADIAVQEGEKIKQKIEAARKYVDNFAVGVVEVTDVIAKDLEAAVTVIERKVDDGIERKIEDGIERKIDNTHPADTLAKKLSISVDENKLLKLKDKLAKVRIESTA